MTRRDHYNHRPKGIEERWLEHPSRFEDDLYGIPSDKFLSTTTRILAVVFILIMLAIFGIVLWLTSDIDSVRGFGYG